MGVAPAIIICYCAGSWDIVRKRQMIDTVQKQYFSRKEAARYLTSIGHSIAFATLAKLATNNNAKRGPRFTRFSNKTVYTREDLDRWAMENGRVVE